MRAERPDHARQDARRCRLGASAASRSRFADGTSAQADAVVAADGVHSRVRETWLGAGRPNFTGKVAYRTTFPAALLDGHTHRRILQVVGAGPPHRDLLRHREPRRGLFRHQRAGARVHRGVLVGDRRSCDAARGLRGLPRAGAARRPRLSARAQMGDRRPRSAAGLGRRPDGAARRRRPSHDAVHGPGRRHRHGGCGPAQPLHRGQPATTCRRRSRGSQRARQERTARIQGTSQQNTFMRQPTDPDWVYGYDAWSAPLPEAVGN